MDGSTIDIGSTPIGRRRRPLRRRTKGWIDRRTREGKLALEWLSALKAEMPGRPTRLQRLALRHAATALAQADLLEWRRNACDPTVSEEDRTRARGVARRSLVDLGIDLSARRASKPTKNLIPSLAELMARQRDTNTP